MTARTESDGEGLALSLIRLLRTRVEEAVSSERDPTVAAVYLYGSAARGRRTPLSDLDVAVLFRDETPEAARRRELPLLGSALARALAVSGEEGREVDVHDLDSLPLAVQGRVLTEGVLLISRDEVRRVRFEERTRRRYFDFLPFQRVDTEEGLTGVRERIHGG